MMQVGVIGMNHQSGSLPLREKLTRIFQLEFSSSRSCVADSVLLVTCNRVELYFSSQQLAATHVRILKVLSCHGLSDFCYALYSYFGRDCFFHLGRVITGMDSAIFGESEIQRQVKLAYEQRRQQMVLSHDLHYLFQKALKAGKELRTSFFVSSKERALPTAIGMTAKWLGVDLKTASILLIGNSRLNRKIIHFLELKGCQSLTLCTRSLEALTPSVKRMDWAKLECWGGYDIVICATYHSAFVLKEKSQRTGNDHRTLVFDLGVPRNVDPALGRNRSVDLYHLSQLEKLLPSRHKKNNQELTLCCQTLDEIVNRQMTLFVKRRQAKWRYLPEPLRKNPVATF
ncbi:MAG: hypothetical protein AAF443_01920 [Chlamydiota bacterium]